MRDEAFLRERFINYIVHRFQPDYLQSGIELAHRALDHGAETGGTPGGAQQKSKRASAWVLEVRQIESSPRSFAQALVFGVLDDADDLEGAGFQRSAHKVKVLPHRVFIAKEIVRHRLIDHRRKRYSFIVGGRILNRLPDSLLAGVRLKRRFLLRAIIATLEERHHHRLEELRPDPEQLARCVFACWNCVSRHFDAVAGGRHAVERRVTRHTGRTRPRQRFQPRQQLFVQTRLLRNTETAARLDLEDHNILPVKAGVQTLQLLKGAHNQPRTDQQQEREPNLGDDQNLIERQSGAA